MKLAVALPLALAACGPYEYVQRVYIEDGTLYQERCRGGACATEEVGAEAIKIVDESRRLATLDRSMVAAALDKVKLNVELCGARSQNVTLLSVHVKVTPDGAVDHVIVRETEDAKLAECVALALREARFPRTQKGAEFTYPFAL
jgi:hypothetical protein